MHGDEWSYKTSACRKRVPVGVVERRTLQLYNLFLPIRSYEIQIVVGETDCADGGRGNYRSGCADRAGGRPDSAVDARSDAKFPKFALQFRVGKTLPANRRVYLYGSTALWWESAAATVPRLSARAESQPVDRCLLLRS